MLSISGPDHDRIRVPRACAGQIGIPGMIQATFPPAKNRGQHHDGTTEARAWARVGCETQAAAPAAFSVTVATERPASPGGF